MYDNPYTQTFQDQISKLLAGNIAQPAQPVAKSESAFDMVDGIEGARSYLGKMLAGQKHVVWDNEKALFYVLQKDANGNPQRIQIGEFTLKPEPSMDDKYVTREDFNLLVSKLDQILNPKEAKTDG